MLNLKLITAIAFLLLPLASDNTLKGGKFNPNAMATFTGSVTGMWNVQVSGCSQINSNVAHNDVPLTFQNGNGIADHIGYLYIGKGTRRSTVFDFKYSFKDSDQQWYQLQAQGPLTCTSGGFHFEAAVGSIMLVLTGEDTGATVGAFAVDGTPLR